MKKYYNNLKGKCPICNRKMEEVNYLFTESNNFRTICCNACKDAVIYILKQSEKGISDYYKNSHYTKEYIANLLSIAFDNDLKCPSLHIDRKFYFTKRSKEGTMDPMIL